LKIAFVVPWIDIGGVETTMFRLGAALKKHGHSVDVVSAGVEGRWWRRLAEFELSGECLPEAGSFCLDSHAAKVCKYLCSQRYDIVLLNHCLYVAPALSMLPDSMTVIPIVHNDEDQVYRVACANWKSWDIAVGVSPRITAIMRRRVPERETRTICNGVELPTQEQWSARLPFTGELKILFVGRFKHDQKGVLFLPQILAGIQAQGVTAKLTLIGDGPDRNQVVRDLSERCQAGSFEWLSTQPGDEVYRRMLHHHVLLMPSLYEGLGLVALEAQACGCVPVASRLTDVTDVVITDSKTGILCPVGEVQSFVAAAVQLARNPKLWAEMSSAGHDDVATLFTIEIMASQYLDLFAQTRQGGLDRETLRSKQSGIDYSVFGWRGILPYPVRRAARFVRGTSSRIVGRN
jgi:glycosyltransferase involved in cell wall biosynthesis